MTSDECAQRTAPGAKSGWWIALLGVSMCLTFIDGYDMNVISYAATHIRSEYGIGSGAMGAVFAAGPIGTLIGGILFGLIGDTAGKKWPLVFCTGAFGLITASFYFVTSAQLFSVVRFCDGLFLGGALPLIWALNADRAPPKYRASVIIIVMLGYSAGNAFGGPLSLLLMPRFGWKSLFVFGGAISLLVAAVLATPLLTQTRPSAPAVANNRSAVQTAAGLFVGNLFEGRLALITPLLWLAYMASSATIYFLVSWTPSLAESIGANQSQAALAGSLHALGGFCSALLLMRLLDRLGAVVVGVLPMMTAVIFTGMAWADLTPRLFLLCTFLLGASVVGGHSAMHSIATLLYPPERRASGAGWATSIAKVGSIMGPWGAGLLLETHLPLQHILMIAAALPLLMSACMLIVGLRDARPLRPHGPTELVAPEGT